MRIATLICLVLFGVAVIAEEASPPPVFTKEQADAGLAAYAKNCASCHMPDLTGNGEIPPLAGASFIGTWEHKTTKDLRVRNGSRNRCRRTGDRWQIIAIPQIGGLRHRYARTAA